VTAGCNKTLRYRRFPTREQLPSRTLLLDRASIRTWGPLVRQLFRLLECLFAFAVPHSPFFLSLARVPLSGPSISRRFTIFRRRRSRAGRNGAALRWAHPTYPHTSPPTSRRHTDFCCHFRSILAGGAPGFGGRGGERGGWRGASTEVSPICLYAPVSYRQDQVHFDGAFRLESTGGLQGFVEEEQRRGGACGSCDRERSEEGSCTHAGEKSRIRENLFYANCLVRIWLMSRGPSLFSFFGFAIHWIG
jgi:hypothetical protein